MVARWRSLAVVVTLAFGLSACGGNSGQTKDSTSGGLTSVTFVAPAVGQVSEMVLAKEKGIFKKHGINLTIKYVEPAAVVPTLMSGKADFGWLNAPATLAARANGVPVQSVAVTSVAGTNPAAVPIQLLVPKGSAITSVKDLVGKRVAVNPAAHGEYILLEALKEAGIPFDPAPPPSRPTPLSPSLLRRRSSSRPTKNLFKSFGLRWTRRMVMPTLTKTRCVPPFRRSPKLTPASRTS